MITTLLTILVDLALVGTIAFVVWTMLSESRRPAVPRDGRTVAGATGRERSPDATGPARSASGVFAQGYGLHSGRPG